jgi:hypothetical protein
VAALPSGRVTGGVLAPAPVVGLDSFSTKSPTAGNVPVSRKPRDAQVSAHGAFQAGWCRIVTAYPGPLAADVVVGNLDRAQSADNAVPPVRSLPRYVTTCGRMRSDPYRGGM